MKRLVILIYLVLLTCSKNYIVNGYLNPAFDKRATYTITVLTPNIKGSASEELRDRLHEHLVMRISKTGHLLPVSITKVKSIEEARGIGTMNVDASEGISIAQELNTQLVCISEIGLQPIGNDKGMPLYCSVTIIDVNSGVEVYRGTGRTANPLSVEAGGEWVIDLATQELIKKMK